MSTQLISDFHHLIPKQRGIDKQWKNTNTGRHLQDYEWFENGAYFVAIQETNQ